MTTSAESSTSLGMTTSAESSTSLGMTPVSARAVNHRVGLEGGVGAHHPDVGPAAAPDSDVRVGGIPVPHPGRAVVVPDAAGAVHEVHVGGRRSPDPADVGVADSDRRAPGGAVPVHHVA